MPDWSISYSRYWASDTSSFVVTRDVQIAEYRVYPNRYRQSRRRRLWNWLRGKGSTAEWIATDLNAIGREMAEKFGLEWKELAE